MISKFRFWCNKVLPMTYDNSLSYYEVLCKITEKLNEVIDGQSGLQTLVSNFMEAVTNDLDDLREYVDSENAEQDATISALDGRVTSEVASLNAELDTLSSAISTVATQAHNELENAVDGLEDLIDTKANKNSPVFTGSQATFAGNILANGEKMVATQEYVNDAVSGATGVVIGTGTFTPVAAIASDFSGYVSTKQYGSIVFIDAYCSIGAGNRFSDLPSAGTIGKITGVDIPWRLGMLSAVTTNPNEQTPTFNNAIVGYLGYNGETAISVSNSGANDNVLILNGFYFTN